MKRSMKDELFTVGVNSVQCAECDEYKRMGAIMWRVDGNDGSGMRHPRFLNLCDDCHAMRERKKLNMHAPTIVEGNFYEVETYDGIEWVDMSVPLVTGNVTTLADVLKLYIESTTITAPIRVRHGYGVRISNPDTLDGEQWAYVTDNWIDAASWIEEAFEDYSDPDLTAWDGKVTYMKKPTGFTQRVVQYPKVKGEHPVETVLNV